MGKFKNVLVEDFIFDEVDVDTQIREMLLDFFEERNLLSESVSSVNNDVKVELAKKVIDVALFDYQFTDIIIGMNKADLLPDESTIWSFIEKKLNLNIPDWVRKANPIKKIRFNSDEYGCRYISFIVGSINKGLVSIKDVLSLIAVSDKNFCFLSVDKGIYYVVVIDPREGRCSRDCTSEVVDWAENLEELLNIEIEEDDFYKGMCKYTHLDSKGSISLQDYMNNLSDKEQKVIDDIITIKYNTLSYGLGYEKDKIILVIAS